MDILNCVVVFLNDFRFISVMHYFCCKTEIKILLGIATSVSCKYSPAKKHGIYNLSKLITATKEIHISETMYYRFNGPQDFRYLFSGYKSLIV